jgi:arylsulfatase A-like enzyme
MLAFALICGVLAEALEVLLLERGGSAAPALRVRVTLLLSYTLIAAGVYLAARLAGTKRRLPVAVAGFLALFILPWLNFDYLPQLRTLKSLAGNVGALVAVLLAAWQIARFPRAAAIAVVLLAIVVNGRSWLPRGLSPEPPRVVRDDGAPRPNVVVLVIDTLRADHLGAYGYQLPTSRHIDDLARRSVVFERAIAQATYTKPSVASLMTGTFVHRHGVISARDALGPELPTLAEQFRAHGYRTAAFSANPWVTPEFRFDRGFDHFESNRAIDVQLTVLYRLARRVGALVHRNGGGVAVGSWLLRISGEPNPSNSRRDEVLIQAFLSWLDGNHRAPFFAYVHLIGPHDPYDPPPASLARFRDPAWGDERGPVKPPARVFSIFEKAMPLDTRTRDMMVAQYNGAIAFADELVERVEQTLVAHGLLDETLMVLTADHGEEFHEHGNWGHGVRLYQEIVGVPLLFHYPRVLAPGRRSDPAMLIDIFPTIVRLAGLPADLPHLHGRNLFAQNPDRTPFAYSEYFSVEGGSYASRMILRDGMKLIDTRDEARNEYRKELYDLRADPTEQRDLVRDGTVQSDAQLTDLEKILGDLANNAPAGRAPQIDVPGATEEILRNLGYGTTLDRH